MLFWVLIFFGKISTDAKYSRGTMKWFNNELPQCNPHLLQNKEFEAMAEILEVQQEENPFWHGLA
jgi:hypothetical protein